MNAAETSTGVQCLTDRGLAPEVAERLVAAGTALHVPAGWTPMHEDTPADRVYLVTDGELEVRHVGDPVATLGAGDLVGEMGPVDHRLRSADVVATDDVEVVAWPRDLFDQLRSDHPGFDDLARLTTLTRRRHNDADGT